MKHLLHIVSIIFLLTGIVQAQDMEVTSTTPTDGSSWQELDANITVTFDENIAPASANYNSITVVGSTSGNLSFGSNYSVSGNVVTINPGADFSYSETITVTVTTQVQSSATYDNGEGVFLPADLASDSVFTFTTKGPAPRPSVVSTVPSANAFNVDADQIISITFDTLMAGTGFDEGVIEIYGSIGGNYDFDDAEQGEDIGNPDITGSGATVSIDLDNSFVAGEIVTVILTTGVSTWNEERQEYGYLESPYIWQFQVGSVSNNALVKVDSSYTSGTSPVGIAFADMDNDGDVDIVTANSGDNNFSVYSNNGSGFFGSPANYSTGSTQPENLVVADFDQDGFEDVAVSSQGSNDVKVFTSNNGSGFNGAETYTVGFAPRAITTGDFDGDGKLDLATSASSSDSVAVLINAYSLTNNGFFGPYKFEVGQGPIGITSFDLNNDNIMDIVATSHGTDNVSVLVGSGNGTNFSAYSNFAVGDGPFSVEAGDVDGDGYSDLVTANEYASTVSVLINDGASGFDTKVDYSVGTTPKDVRLVDVNGDGDLDILTVDNGGTATVTYLENAGDGTFSLAYTYDATGGAFGFNAGDLNGDEIIDFAVGSSGNTFLQVVSLYDGPMVTSVSPVTNTFNVSASTNISATLDESIGTSSVSSTTFTVHGSVSGQHTGSFSFSNSDKTITFDPTNDFEPGERVTVTVSSGIQDPGGNSLPEPHSFQFNVSSNSGYGDFGNLTSYTVSGTNTDNIVDGATADFNGDGYPDIVAIDYNNAQLKVFFNDGDGTFDDASVTISTPGFPVDVAAADIDNDGDMDLLTANNNAAGFSIIKNNGNSTFATRTDISYSSATTIAIGDMDNDGYMDALLDKAGSDTLYTFFNDGSGGYSGAPSKTKIASSMTDIEIVDAENDNYLDIATVHGGSVNTIYLLSNNGDGTFTNEDSRSVSGSPAAVAFGEPYGSLTFGVATSSGNSFFRTGLNTNYTEFAGNVNLSAGSNPQSIIVSDFDDISTNSDNSGDFLMANYGNSTLSLLSSDDFDYSFTETTISLTANPWDLATADFDGDGRMDVVTFNNNGEISVLYNMDTTPPTVSSVSPVNNATNIAVSSNITVNFDMAINSSTLDSSSVVVMGSLYGQYDGTYSYNSNTLTIDPDTDFLPGEQITVSVTTGVENTNGISAVAYITQFNTAGGSANILADDVKVGATNPYGAELADVDGDGDLDLLVVNFSADSVSIRLNDGAGTFGAITPYSTGAGPIGVETGDFDRQNGMDFVVSNYSSNTVSVFTNNGSGSYSSTDYATGSNPIDAVTEDFNKDGYTDIIVFNRSGASATILLNDGDGTFTSSGTITNLGTNKDMIWATDIDNDNDIDIVTGGAGQTLTIAKNNGDATFAAASATSIVSHGAAFTDIDGDNEVDLIVSSDATNTVSVYLNDGDGGFSSASDTDTLTSAQALTTIDFENDGDADILVINYDDQEVELLVNDGSGAFDSTATFNVGQYARTITAADLDGDGDLDIVTANRGSNDISINFSAAELPLVTSVAASSVTDSSATLNGTINARNYATDAEFAYKLSSSGTYSDTLTATPSQVTGSSDTNISFTLTGLLPNTSYDFKALGTNEAGEVAGTELSFATGERAPYLVTGNASSITLTSATINGTVSAQNSSANAYVAYGTSTGVYSDTVAVNENPLGSAMDTLSVTASLSGLNNSTTYYYTVFATNNAGTTTGTEQTFSTLALPLVVTSSPDSISGTGVKLQGTINAQNTTTDARFVYKLSSSGTYADTVTASPAQVTGSSVTPIWAALTGLTPNTSYDFKALGINENGEVSGADSTFTTGGLAPVVTTNAATDIEKNTVTLNGAVNAQNEATNAYFEYGTTAGVYTDTVAANENPFNDGTNDVSITGSVTGLSPLTKYYFRAFATNSGGTTIGEVDSVTTLPEPPVITSVSPVANSVDGALAADIVINFDQAMDNGTITSSTVRVIGSMRGLYSGSFSYGTNSATFDPDSSFFPGETIKISLTTGIESALSEPLASAYVYSIVAEQVTGSEVFAISKSTSYSWAGAEQVALADFNDDGYLDIVGTVNGGTALTFTRMNNGDGTFSSSVSNSLTGSIGVATGDINNDGYVDIAYTVKTGGMAIYWNNGTNPFNSGQTLSGSSAAQNVALADINGDGYLDFIFTESGVKVVPNNGSGNFNTAASATYGSSGVWDVSVADINDDNHPDIVASLGTSGGVTVYTNDGDGTFTSDSTYTAGTGSQGVQVVDVNGDDVADIVVSNLTSDNISVLIGNGDGTFATAVNYAVADEPYDFVAFDINGDGYTDIATTHQSIDSVSTMINNGDGTFADPVYYLTGDGPRGIAAGDVNNDGEMDILTADNLSTSHTLRLKSPLAPSIASSTPAANALNVATTSNISVTFEVPIDVATLDSSKIAVIGSLTGEYFGSFTSVSSTGFTFDPDSTFKEGEFITVTLFGIESQSGIAMGVQTFDFSTPWPTVSATKEFVDGGTFQSVTAPVEMISTDVDNDGDLDLLIVGNGNQLYVRLNNGDGTFASSVSYSTNSNVADMYLSDIDGDGDLDVMTAHTGNSGIDTQLNDGDGTFTGGYTGFGTVAAIVTTDLDNDGYIDVIGANPSDNYLSFNRNQGNNSYQPAGFGGSLSFAAGTTPVDIAMADLNGDGRPDFVTANSGSDNVSYFMNNGDGTVATAVNYSVGTGPTSVVISDVDEDGYADIIVANETSDNVSVLINNGDGTFAAAVNYAAGDGPGSITLYDFNGDGDIDLLIPNSVSDSVSVLESNGDGTFGTRTAYAAGDEPVSVVMLDYDNDGDIDMLVANKTGNTISIIEATGGPSVERILPVANRHYVPADTNIVVKFDRPMDGTSLTSNTITVVGSLSGRHGGTISLSNSDSTAIFNPSSDFEEGEKVTVVVTTNVEDANNDKMELPYTSEFTVESTAESIVLQKTDYSDADNVTGMATADLDGDGDNDIVVTDTENSYAIVYLNNGGTFSYSSDYSVGSNPRAVSLADVDNDGDIDIMTLNSSSNNVSVLLNNGSGSFASAVNYSASSGLYDIKNADINGDGYTDILLTKGYFAALLNNGDGTFGSLVNFSTFSYSYLGYDLDLADMDGDGDLDAVQVASSNNPPMQVIYNDGNGDFTSNELYYLETSISDVVTADFDQDGYPDIAVTDYSDNVVKILTNNGDGTVDSTASISVNSSPQALTVGDYDGDGDLDISVYHQYQQYISIILNDGSGNFGTATTYQTNQLTSDYPVLVSADFDGDGQIDIAVPYGSGFNVMIPSPPPAAPSVASSLNFGTPSNSQVSISANKGSATGMLFIMKEGSAVDFVPSNDVSYSANSTFGSGSDLGGGNYAVLNFTGYQSGGAVYGLTRDTEYHVAVYTYNSADGRITYSTTAATGNITTLLAPTQSGGISVSGNFGTRLQVYKNGGNGSARILAIREGSSVTWTPDDSTTYTANTDFSSAVDLGDGTKIVSNDNSSSPVEISGLSLNTTYYFAQFEYFGDAGTENYYTTPATANVTTSGTAGYAFDSTAGNAISFAGYDGEEYYYTSLDNQFEFTDSFTVELWVKPDSIGTATNFLYHSGSSDSLLVLGLNAAGNFTGIVRDANTSSNVKVTSSTVAAEGQWYHVAISADSADKVRLYVNAVAEDSAAIVDVALGGELDYTEIGGVDGEGNFFYGDMDELRFWGDQRTVSELRSNRRVTLTGFPDNLIGYWQFNEDYGNDAEDPYISFNSFGSPELVASSAPLGGTLTTLADFQSGTANLGNVQLTLTDAFDNPVDIEVLEISSEPVNVPSGYKSTVGDRFFIIELIGDPGTFSADLTLTYGSGVITSNEEASPDSVILYKQDSNETSSWLAFGGATSATSATGVVTWTGITSFSQFVAVGPDDAIPAPTYWDKDDAVTTFTKLNYADWTDSANQDCITDDVCLTREDRRGLFNIITETEFDTDNYTSPDGTEWAIGTVDDVESLTFDTFYNTLDQSIGSNILDNDMVLHLIDENIYIDIKFTSWTESGDGGGYGYIRGKGPNEEFNSPFQATAGSAINFDGGNNYYYSEAYFDSLPNDFTIEMWTKPNSIGSQMVILTHDSEYMWMGIDASGNFFGLLLDETLGDTVRITGTTTATAGDWYHLALTGETDGNMKLYVNGREEASTSIGQVETNTGTYWLGTDYGEDYYYDGSIDEVRIWNAVRTPSQIRGNMYTPLSGLPSDLKVYWQFNEGTGDYTADYLNGYSAAVEYDYGEWVTSGAPYGSGSVNTISAFQSGSTSAGNAALSMSDGFDNPVDIQVSELSSAPNSFPSGYNSNMGGKYFIIDLFGDPGTFSANLTLSFGSGVVTAAQETDPSTIKLFKRESNSSGSWTEFGGATTAIASTGTVTWTGITSFSQFIAVGEDNETPPKTIWSFANDSVSFAKANFADYTDSANQDCLTENVCITRADSKGLFNYVEESGFTASWDDSPSPEGTLWAYGTTADVETMTFIPLMRAIYDDAGFSGTSDIVGEQFVMYMETDDIYVDVLFTSWQEGAGGGTPGGGGFSYIRGAAAPEVLDIQIDDDTNVIAYIDSAYTFESTFFDLSDNFADSALTLSIDASLEGALFIDNDSNGDYDSGTDDLILESSTYTYTPSGSAKLRYITDTGGIESVTVKLASAGSADSVLLNIYGVEGDPSISGVADENSWHLMSNPFTTNLGTLFADIWTQGAVNSNAPQGNATLYTFSQDSGVYVPIETDLDTTSLEAGTGVLAYIFAFDDYAEGVPESGGWPKTITNYGNPFGSAVDVTVKNVDYDESTATSGYEGFALFGNPFGWSLSADSLIATVKRGDATANNYVYRWDAVNGQFEQITTGAIDPYESVFLRVEASGTSVDMNLDYSDRYQDNPTKRRKETTVEMILSHKGSGIRSESYLRFDEKAKAGIDPSDAYYLGSYANKYANMYTLIGDQTLTINNVPAKSGGELEYPVYLDASVTGDFELQWNSQTLPENGSYILEDLKTGIRIDLKEQSKYSFTRGIRTKITPNAEDETEVDSGTKEDDLEAIDELADKQVARDLDIESQKNGQSTEKSVKRKTGLLLPSKSKSVATPTIDEQIFKLIINTGVVNDIEEDLGLPAVVELYQNYPNPFNPTSIIRYGVPEMSDVTLEVFDMLGRKVYTLIDGETKQPGRYNVQFNARSLASGMYIYRLKIGNKVLTKKMTLIK